MARSLERSTMHSTDAFVTAAALADGAGCEVGIDCSLHVGRDATDTDIGAKKGKRGTRASKAERLQHKGLCPDKSNNNQMENEKSWDKAKTESPNTGIDELTGRFAALEELVKLQGEQLQSERGQHASLQARVDYLEQLLGDSAVKHAQWEELHVEQARLLKQQVDQHGEHHSSLQERIDSMEDRHGYIHELVAEVSLRNTGGLQLLHNVLKDQEWMKREMAEIGGKVDHILEVSEISSNCSNEGSGSDSCNGSSNSFDATSRGPNSGVAESQQEQGKGGQQHAPLEEPLFCFHCGEMFRTTLISFV